VQNGSFTDSASVPSSDGASTAADKVYNEDYQRNREQKMDEASAYVQGETEKPQYCQNYKDGPKHTFLLWCIGFSGATLRWDCCSESRFVPKPEQQL
jgi:hypothetical protein